MLLFGRELRSYRELPLRYAESSTLHRDELAGTLHGLLRVRHITQDDAHIFCTPEQIEDEIFGCLDFARVPLRPVRARRALRALDAAGEASSAPTRSGTSPRARCARRSSAAGIEYVVNEGDGAFYGPKIDLHMTDVLGRSWQMGTIQLDAQMPQQFGLTYMGADNARARAVRRSTARCSARSSASSASSPSTTAARSRSGSRPCRCACCRSARTIASAAATRRAARAAGYRVDVDEPTRRSASGSATPSSRRSRSRSSSATASRTSRSRSASAAASSRREALADFARAACYAVSLKSRGGPVPHLPGREPRGGSTESTDEEHGPLRAAAFCVQNEEE